MNIILVCGAPRSSTTWVHNALIETGQYSGIPAVDTDFIDYSVKSNLFSDEDKFLTEFGIKSKHSYVAPYFKKKFINRLKQYESVFLKDGNLLLESPYFVFVIDLFHEIYGSDLRVLHMRRSYHDVAASMVKHPHLGRILKLPLRKTCDFVVNILTPVELLYANQSVLNYVRRNYDSLSLIDKAAFKWHCFVNAYKVLSKKTNVATFEFNVSKPIHADFQELGRFCNLSNGAIEKIENNFKISTYPYGDMNGSLRKLLELHD